MSMPLKLIEVLDSFQHSHRVFEEYYEGNHKVRNLGIAVPPTLGNRVDTVLGWPSTVVDVLEERLDWLGWDDDGLYDLESVYLENQLDYESSMVHIDTLLYGTGFVAVHPGMKNEPNVLITAESPKNSTGLWDRRTRRLREAVTRHYTDGKWLDTYHYELNQTTHYRRDTEESQWKMDGKPDVHRMNRIPLVRFINRGRAGRRDGRSEITRAIRSYTDLGARTLLGMEINREFFSAPQRYVLGAKEDAFTDEAGNPIPGWKAILGALWRLSRDDEAVQEGIADGLPKVGQFPANPAGPFLEQLRGISMLIAAEAGIPASYLGFSTDNPPSADSIRAQEARLVKRSERRQAGLDPSWSEVGILATMISGNKSADRSELLCMWRDAATPTKAADADRAMKLVSAGILPADSDVTYEMIGLNKRQVAKLRRDKDRKDLLAILNADDTEEDTNANRVGEVGGSERETVNEIVGQS